MIHVTDWYPTIAALAGTDKYIVQKIILAIILQFQATSAMLYNLTC